MKPHIGLNEKSMATLTGHLHRLLANETMLATLTRIAHWNVTGPLFGPLHELFGKQYDQLNIAIDDVAERIRALGRPVDGGLRNMTRIATVKEYPALSGDPKKLIGTLLDSHELIIRDLRDVIEAAEEAGDSGTADFLTGLLEAHEKTAWMLRASL